MAASSVPDGKRWKVVYTRANSKHKFDGSLALRHMNSSIVKKLFLFDSAGARLADRLLKRFENPPDIDGDVEFEGYKAVVVEDALGAEGLPRPTSSAPAPLPPQRGLARISSSVAPSRPVERAPIGNVMTKWNVLYTKLPPKKVNRSYDGVLRLEQKIHCQQKVILCDDEGKQIDEQFLGGDREIICGKPLKFERHVVEVLDITEGSRPLADVVVIQDSPVNQKKLQLHHPKSSFQGMATNRVSTQDPLEGDIWDLIHDSGTGKIRAPSQVGGKLEIQPKRRDSKQVINSLKRPVNSFSCETSTAANFSIRKPVEREGTTMLSSTSRSCYEEERSASIGGIEGKIQNLSVGKACSVSFDDDCIYIEHEVIQQKNRLGNYRPGSVINLDDQFVVVMEQQGSASVQSEASPQTGIDFSKCSGEVKNVLDEKRFRVRDFWVGYKFYCFGYYSHCDLSKEQFLDSKMGQVVCLLHNERGVRWGAKFDETVRQVWAMMEEYIKIRYDKDCTNLRALVEEFEDVNKLSTSEYGSLLLQLIKDDEHGTEGLYKHSRDIQIQSTNIFDQLRSRLVKVDSNLGNLKKSSGKSSGILSDLNSRNLGSRDSCETGSVDKSAFFSGDSTDKPKERRNSAMPSFDLGI